MKARILNFRQGRHTQKTNQLLLSVDSVDSRTAATKLAGKKLVYMTRSGRPIAGKIAGAHGNNGVVRARFSRGVPGEAIGKEIELK